MMQSCSVQHYAPPCFPPLIRSGEEPPSPRCHPGPPPRPRHLKVHQRGGVNSQRHLVPIR